ncbi:MAG: hypothetical protein RJA98_690 [Pseudomonadota bacterium]|jgi:hypothetical protein
MTLEQKGPWIKLPADFMVAMANMEASLKPLKSRRSAPINREVTQRGNNTEGVWPHLEEPLDAVVQPTYNSPAASTQP